MSTQTAKMYTLHNGYFNATRNDLPALARSTSIEALSTLLIEMIDVSLCARHAKWNVRGTNRLARNELFESLAEGLNDQIDVAADRICALGGIPRGTAHAVACDSTLRPYPIELNTDQEHLDALACRLGLLAGEARISVQECRDLGDPVTVHILTRASEQIEKLLWLLESHNTSRS